jgi:acetoacetate decarboxylase
MRFEKDEFYRMPLVIGPLASFGDGRASRLHYRRVEVVSIQYQTDADAIPRLLPECFRPAESPLVTVVFGYNEHLELMAGRGYRLAAVQIAASFEGEEDRVDGDYNIVMFEDQTWPIIGGREDLGVHKLYADISPIRSLPNGHLRCDASLWGHLLFGIDLSPPRKQNVVVRMVASKMVNARHWLGYKYIPSLDGPPDADHPTITKNDVKIDELWFSKTAEIYCGTAQYSDLGDQSRVVDAIRSLPIRTLERAIHFRGSAVLRYDLSRRLR